MAYGVRNGQEFKGMWAWAMGRCLWTMGWGEGGMAVGIVERAWATDLGMHHRHAM